MRELGCGRLLFVSFSDPDKPLHRLWIEEWLKTYLTDDKEKRDDDKEDDEDTKTATTTAQLLLDPTKSAYEAYCISSNLAASYGVNNVLYYARAILFRGRRSVEVKGEAGQLGADFVISPRGKVLLRHYCKNPTDRVAVSDIVECLQQQRRRREQDQED